MRMMTKWLIVACVLTACIAPQPQTAPIQIMPYHDSGVRAGCIRAMARLVVQSKSYEVWPMDRIYSYCDEIERSFYDEQRQKDLQST